jgi:hypothetical protein
MIYDCPSARSSNFFNRSSIEDRNERIANTIPPRITKIADMGIQILEFVQVANETTIATRIRPTDDGMRTLILFI